MDAHLSEGQFERYRQRRMSPAELLTADDHLAMCEACRRRLGDRQSLEAAAAAIQSDFRAAECATTEHLSYEQLAAYLDNEITDLDREILESHLENCRSCADEERDLREFAARMAGHPSKAYAPLERPATIRGRLRHLLAGVRTKRQER